MSTRTLADLEWPRRTDRLELRPIREDDIEPMFAYRSREDVSRWLSTWWQDVEAFRARFGDAQMRRAVLVATLDGSVVGDLYLRAETPWKQTEATADVSNVQAELGWVFDPACGGTGLATEAVRELLKVAFGEIGYRRVIAHCFTANTPSWRLMERVGMRREAHAVADGLHRELGWLDGYTYAMLASEWFQHQ